MHTNSSWTSSNVFFKSDIWDDVKSATGDYMGIELLWECFIGETYAESATWFPNSINAAVDSSLGSAAIRLSSSNKFTN